MKTKLYIAAAVVLVALVALCGGLLRKVKQLETERDRYKGNTTALLSDMKRMQIDSTTYAVDLHTLRLNIDEYKRFRADDAELIKKLNIRIKSLETAARHQLAVDAPIRAPAHSENRNEHTAPASERHNREQSTNGAHSASGNAQSVCVDRAQTPLPVVAVGSESGASNHNHR